MGNSSTAKGTYILVHDKMLCVKAIDLEGEKINMTSTDHLVYQKLRHMYEKLKKAGKACFPSKKWLSSYLAVSDRSVASSLDKLRRVGLVEWRQIRRYGNLRNVYTVLSVLKHKVYVSDIKDPVEFEFAEEAVRRRLDVLSDEAGEMALVGRNSNATNGEGGAASTESATLGTKRTTGSIQGVPDPEALDDWDF